MWATRRLIGLIIFLNVLKLTCILCQISEKCVCVSYILYILLGFTDIVCHLIYNETEEGEAVTLRGHLRTTKAEKKC